MVTACLQGGYFQERTQFSYPRLLKCPRACILDEGECGGGLWQIHLALECAFLKGSLSGDLVQEKQSQLCGICHSCSLYMYVCPTCPLQRLIVLSAENPSHLEQEAKVEVVVDLTPQRENPCSLVEQSRE